MSENDFNFRGSENIMNKGDLHWPRTRHCQKHTQLAAQLTISETGSHRISEIWLQTKRSGSTETMWLTFVSKERMMPVQFSPIRYPTSLRSSFDSLEFMENPIAKNHWNRIRQYFRQSSKLILHAWKWNFSQTRRSIWKCALIFFFVLKNFATFYKTDFFQRTTRSFYFFGVYLFFWARTYQWIRKWQPTTLCYQ